ncbi:MAG TPA: DUF1330 domain-containing protein [Pseudolabrys sp.]|jgi:uncharacterized protein (DUF1330 family)
MKGPYVLALAAAIVCLATVAGGALYAATVRPVYVVVEIDEITDPEGFKNGFQKRDMRAAVEAMVADARYVARTDNVTALDGTAPKSFIIISFQNMKKAKAYSEGVQEFTAVRLKTTKSRSFIVEGL